jgi:hypothetical protein
MEKCSYKCQTLFTKINTCSLNARWGIVDLNCHHIAMSKGRSYTSSKHREEAKDAATKKEIDRQHALLSADMDRKQLRGNVTLEDWRHHRQTASLTQKEKREHYQIKTQKKELLSDLKKVRSSCTGHYDDTKSPLENIQLALRTKCQTPPKSSRLDVRYQGFAMRRCKSSEALSSRGTRASSSLSYSPKPLSFSKDNVGRQRMERPKTAAPVISTRRQDEPDPTVCKKKTNRKQKIWLTKKLEFCVQRCPVLCERSGYIGVYCIGSVYCMGC